MPTKKQKTDLHLAKVSQHEILASKLATRSSSPDLLGQLCFKVRYQQEAALTQTLTQQHNKHSRVR